MAVPIELTTTSFQALCESLVTAVANHLAAGEHLVTCLGTLGPFAKNDYPVYYDTPLEADGTIIKLDVPKELAARNDVQPGDYIRAIGLLAPNVYKGALTFRLKVTQIAVAQRPQIIERERMERVNLEWLKGLRKHSTQFPSGVPLRISVICPKTDDVFDDFMSKVGDWRDDVDIERLSIPIGSDTEIIRAIKSATGNIIVLIRGGGSPEDFQVFDRPQIVEAMAQCGRYRVVGIGHAKHTTLVGLVADFVAITPTEAGQYIAAQLELNRSAAIANRIARHGDLPVKTGHETQLPRAGESSSRKAIHRWKDWGIGLIFGSVIASLLYWFTA
jgi:exonuclease VII large subunit